VEAVFAAVADPTRRALLERLRERGPLSISDLSEGYYARHFVGAGRVVPDETLND